jgi:hypothetical protein
MNPHRIRNSFIDEMSAQVDMRKRFRGNQAAIMVSDAHEIPPCGAYSTLLTGKRAAREKKGRG